MRQHAQSFRQQPVEEEQVEQPTKEVRAKSRQNTGNYPPPKGPIGMRNRSVELKRGVEDSRFNIQNETPIEDIKLDYDVTLNHKIMFMNNVSAVPLA